MLPQHHGCWQQGAVRVCSAVLCLQPRRLPCRLLWAGEPAHDSGLPQISDLLGWASCHHRGDWTEEWHAVAHLQIVRCNVNLLAGDHNAGGKLSRGWHSCRQPYRVLTRPAGMAHSDAQEPASLCQQGQTSQLAGKAHRCMPATRGRGLIVCVVCSAAMTGGSSRCKVTAITMVGTTHLLAAQAV